VARLPNNPDRVFSNSQSEDDVAAAIANLFATPPPRVDELFVDTDVRTKIGVLIAQAMNKPKGRDADTKSR
jgi:hypothetical protein